MSRLRHGVAALGVAAAAWLLPGEALAAEPPSQPPASKAKPRKAPEKSPAGSSEQDTKEAQGLLAKAKALSKSKQFAEASKLTRQCIEVAPLYAECHLQHGVALARTGDVDTAARSYRRFLELDPDSPQASKVRELLRQYDEARSGKH